MINLDREDFIHNVADDLSSQLNVVVRTTTLKKDGGSSLAFIYSGEHFSLNVDLNTDRDAIVSLFYGIGVEMGSKHIQSINLNRINKENYTDFIQDIVDKVESRAEQ